MFQLNIGINELLPVFCKLVEQASDQSSAFMGAVRICLSCTPRSHASCQHVAVSEHAATCTVGSFGSQVELKVWQWTAGNVEEAGIMVVEQSRVDTQKAVFISSCFAVPKLWGLFLPFLHTKEMEINFYMW